MKLLKIWGCFLLTCAVVLYGIGVFTGEFIRAIGLLFWGTSMEAMLLLVTAVFCLLLSVTVFLVANSLTKK